MNYYLAIDQGTHASRAILYDEKGRSISSEVEPVALFRRENGFIEQDALEILHSTTKALNRLLSNQTAEVQKRITACGLACQRSTIVACNHQAEPLSPAISWQDVRGESYLKELPLTTEQVQHISGLPLSPHYAASKYRWLLSNNSKIRNLPVDELYLAPLTSFLLLHLVPQSPFVIDHSHAQRMQLMDIQLLDWSEELTRAFRIPRQTLPLCKPMCDDYGSLRGTDIPVTAVCGDQNAALWGSGELSKETALINLGSGAFVLRKLPEFTPSSRLLTGIAYSTTNNDKAYHLREGTINGAGNALNWFQQQLTPSTKENWREQLPIWLQEIDTPPLFINSVGGLGSPWWSNQIEPFFIHDIPNSNEEPNIAMKSVAIIESIVFLIQENLNIMFEEHPLSLLKLSGGLSQLDGLCQKMANLSQRPVQRLNDTEATARGVAWLASGRKTAWAVGNSTYFEPAEESGLHTRYQRFHQKLTELTQ